MTTLEVEKRIKFRSPVAHYETVSLKNNFLREIFVK